MIVVGIKTKEHHRPTPLAAGETKDEALRQAGPRLAEMLGLSPDYRITPEYFVYGLADGSTGAHIEKVLTRRFGQ